MPRLENLKQAQVLQVTNPTGVMSAASMGAAASDGYADMAKALKNTAEVVTEVWGRVGEEEKKIKLREYERRSNEIMVEAKDYAQKESKDPLGGDKVELYKQRFNELTDSYLGSQKDGSIKREGSEFFKDRASVGYIQMLQAVPEDAVKGLHNMRKQSFRERSAQVYTDISSGIKGNFLKIIEDNISEIDDLSMTYSKDQRELFKSTESAELGTTAVNSFIAKKDYKSANNAVDILAAKTYLDGDTATKLKKQIAEAQTTEKNRIHTDGQRAEGQVSEVVKQTQRQIMSTSIADMTQITSAQDQKAYVDTRRLQYEQGLITLEQFNYIKKLSSKMALRSTTKFKEDYTEALDALNRGEDITEMVQGDLDKNKYHPAVARQLLEAQSMRDGITRDTGGPKGGVKTQGFKEAGKILNDTKGMFTPRERLEIQSKVTTDTMNGGDPVEVTKAAVAKSAKNVIQKNRAAPGAHTAISLIKAQTTLRDLDSIAPLVQAEVQKARKNGNDAQGVEILKSLRLQRQLLGAAGSDEVVNERRR